MPLPDPELSRYTPTQGGGAGVPNRPPNPLVQARRVLNELDQAWRDTESSEAAYHVTRRGVYLEFKGEHLVTKSLELIRGRDKDRHIRLLNIREETVAESEQTSEAVATIFVPKDRKDHFFDKLEAFLGEERTQRGERVNAPLIESIQHVRAALEIECFWRDLPRLLPGDVPVWCEVWLSSDRADVEERFREILRNKHIHHKPNVLRFPERSVILIHASQQQLADLICLSDDIAELRRAKDAASFWLDQTNADQAEWAQNLLDRLDVSPDANMAVCILDCGVNREHPLIEPVLVETDCQTVISEWGVNDDQNHGTRMAGVAAYGSLEDLLTTGERIQLRHVLESVKIIPPSGQTDPELWGYMTAQGVARAIAQEPERLRVVCMAVSSTDGRDQGRPSSWSAEVDQICAGVDGLDPKLFLVCAGNIAESQDWRNYPDSNVISPIHDPAQAWNALTVGAYTELEQIHDPTMGGYKPIAFAGNLSPFSSTSCAWEQQKWPIKPEILMEGGNAAVSATGDLATVCDDLSVLSTHYRPDESIFWPFHETSCATAKASWFAAQLQIDYPDYWPETIRGLLVHSASWTQGMRDMFLKSDSKRDYAYLLHVCGYGVPNLQQARYSAENSLTLISQQSIQPFIRESGRAKTNVMHLYELPWPVKVLHDLPPETEVSMRVTLSYFVEPGPGEVGWKERYRYASHALRFRLNSPLETSAQFQRRINEAARDEENGRPDTESDSGHWTFGEARNVGSIHSDIWNGSAQELAASRWLAVHPVIGWWRERTNLGRVESESRYSLIVSISTPETDVELYTPIAIQLDVPITQTIET